MKRKTYTAELTRDGVALATVERFAWNSAARASEELVRDYAHAAGEAFEGDTPSVLGKPPTGIYRRSWRGARTGQLVMVRMQPNDTQES